MPPHRHAIFRQKKVLESHLVGAHSYQMVCAYCADFVWTPGQADLFRTHVKIEHGEVAHNDAVIMNSRFPRFRPAQLESLLMQHSFLRAPNIVAPSIPATGDVLPIGMRSDTPGFPSMC
jgi:hypothetical protein